MCDSSSPVNSLRVALVGKGGAGKSMICGTLARVLARRGHRVLALDVDTLPGLALSLGLSLDATGEAGLPEDLDEHVEGRGWVLKEGVDVVELVAQHSVAAPDGIRFLQLGKLPGRMKLGSTTAFRAVLERFREEGWSLIGDLAAGTRQPFFGWSNFAEVVLIVVEPSAKSTLTARRLAKLADERKTEAGETRPRPLVGWVANKLRSEKDLPRIERALNGHPLPLLAALPYDEQCAAAERLGQAPMDVVPNALAVVAIEKLATWLEQRSQVSKGVLQ